MIRIAHLLILTFLYQICSAQQTGNYKAGDTLRVFALSGLKLRDQNNLSGKVVATMKFGEAVVIEQTFQFDQNHSGTIEGFKGHWIKIKYGTLTGFAFDGFLSALPVPETRPTQVNEKELSKEDMELEEQYRGQELEVALTAYIEKHFTKICDPVEYYNGSDGEGFQILQIQKLSRNFTEIKIGGWEGYGTELIMPDTRLSEVKNLILILANGCGLKDSILSELKNNLNALTDEGKALQEVLSLDMFWLRIKRYPTQNNSLKWSIEFDCASS